MKNQPTFSVNIAGVKRELPLFEVAPGVKIALFNVLGDTEVVVAAGRALAEKLPAEVDILVTPEVKSLPLAYELSRLTGKPYIVARKVVKPYMVGSISAEVTSITTGKPQTLWLDGKDLASLKGKRVGLVDDVVSTGSTFTGLYDLMTKAGAKVVAEVVVFTEGDANTRKNVIALGHLPVFVE